MVCRKCGSDALFAKWSWPRKEKRTIGSGDSIIEFNVFISRSTRYVCSACGFSFLKYSRKEGAEKLTESSTCNIIKVF